MYYDNNCSIDRFRNKFTYKAFLKTYSTLHKRKMAKGLWPRLTLSELILDSTPTLITILTPSICWLVSSIPVKMGLCPIFFLFLMSMKNNCMMNIFPDLYHLPSFKRSKDCSAYQMLCIRQLSSCLILMEMEWLHLVCRDFIFKWIKQRISISYSLFRWVRWGDAENGTPSADALQYG